MHRLPEGYVLTRRGTAASAWHARTAIQAYHRWNMPDLANQVCAIKNCEPGDFSEKKEPTEKVLRLETSMHWIGRSAPSRRSTCHKEANGR